MKHLAIGIVALSFMVAIMAPKPVHASSNKANILSDIADSIVKAVAKKLSGHPEWSDEDLKGAMDKAIQQTVDTAMDYPDSDQAKEAITNHCYMVYTMAWHPEIWEGRFYAGMPVPDYYLDGTVWDQLEVCYRTGYIPFYSPYQEGSMDIE